MEPSPGIERISRRPRAVLGSFTVSSQVTEFAVDRDGYAYVILTSSESQVLAFSPEAFRSGGMAKPIATLTATGYNNRFGPLATDAAGRLYGGVYFGLDIFDHPHRTSTQSITILPPDPKVNPDWARFSGALAFDEAQKLYANIGYQTYCEGRRCKAQYWQDTDFDAITGWRKPGRTDSMISAGECSVNYSSYMFGGTVTGMDVHDGYLEAACTGDVVGVWVYRADRFKRQHAIEMLGSLTSPTDAKVGP